jgi:hypothetical protein
VIRVKRTDDSLISKGSRGVIDKKIKGGYEATFNFTTPWRVSGKYVDASGGPVRFVKNSEISGPTKKATIIMHDGGEPFISKEKEFKVKEFEVRLKTRR